LTPTAGTLVKIGDGNSTFVTAPAGKAVCIVTTGTPVVSGAIQYVQQ
jgi:hypothetical protein